MCCVFLLLHPDLIGEPWSPVPRDLRQGEVGFSQHLHPLTGLECHLEAKSEFCGCNFYLWTQCLQYAVRGPEGMWGGDIPVWTLQAQRWQQPPEGAGGWAKATAPMAPVGVDRLAVRGSPVQSNGSCSSTLRHAGTRTSPHSRGKVSDSCPGPSILDMWPLWVGQHLPLSASNTGSVHP